MKYAIQRSLSIMLAMIMAFSTPTAGLNSYAAPATTEFTQQETDTDILLSNNDEVASVSDNLPDDTSAEISGNEVPETEEISSTEEDTATAEDEASTEENTTATEDEASTEEATEEEITSEEAANNESTDEDATTEAAPTAEILPETTPLSDIVSANDTGNTSYTITFSMDENITSLYWGTTSDGSVSGCDTMYSEPITLSAGDTLSFRFATANYYYIPTVTLKSEANEEPLTLTDDNSDGTYIVSADTLTGNTSISVTTEANLSLLPYITFDCDKNNAYSAEISVSEEFIAIHYDSEDKETDDCNFYDGHKFYTNADKADIRIAPNDDYYLYSDELVVDVEQMDSANRSTVSFKPVTSATDSYTLLYSLPLNLDEIYTLRPQLDVRYRTVSLDIVDAAHASIAVNTNSKNNTTGITLEKNYNNRYVMDCRQTDTFEFSIKNSDIYSYQVTYNDSELTADTESVPGYSVYSLKNDTTSAETLLPTENTIIVTETVTTNTLTLEYDNANLDIAVTSGSKCLAPTVVYDEISMTESYTVLPNEALTVTVKGKENCTIDSTLLVGEESTSVQLKKGAYTFTPVVGTNYTFRVNSTAHYALDSAIYAQDGSPIYAKNKVYTLSSGYTYDFYLKKGASAATICRAEATPVSADASADDISFDISKEQAYAKMIPTIYSAGNTYEITLYADEDEESKVGSYKIAIAPMITDAGLTITGAKVQNGITTITQEANTQKEYALKLSTKQKTANLNVLTAVTNDDTFASAQITETGKLRLTTKAKTEEELAVNNTVTLCIYDSTDTVSEGADPVNGRLVKTVTIVLTKSTLENVAAPTIKLVSATDTSLTLKLTAPAKINLKPTEGTLHYVISATPTDASILQDENDPYDTQVIEYWEPVNSSSTTVTINPMTGSYDGIDYIGCARDFNISVILVNTKDSYRGNHIDLLSSLADDAVYYKGNAGNQVFSTKEPTIATKLNLKQKTKKIYVSDITAAYNTDIEIPIATVSCDKDETYSYTNNYPYQIEDISADTQMNTLSFYEKNGTIYVQGMSDIEGIVGKHTIQVTAPGPNHAKKLTKTFTLEVKASIAEIEFHMSSTLYKAQGKAATIKPTEIYCLNAQWYEYKNPKLKWELLVELENGDIVPLNEARDHYLYGYLSIHAGNGAVTLKKNFIVNEAKDNIFYVLATPANEPNNDCNMSCKVTIVTEKDAQPDRLLLLRLNNQTDAYDLIAQDKSSVTAGLLDYETYAYVLKNGAPIKSSYTEEEVARYFITDGYSLKSNKLISFYASDSSIYLVSGVGKNITLTATSMNGNNWKATLKGLEIVPTDTKLGFVINKKDLPNVCTVSAKGLIQDSEEIFIPADGVITYPGGLPTDLYVQVGYVTNNKHIWPINWNDAFLYDYYNYQVNAVSGCEVINDKELLYKLKKFILSQDDIPEEEFLFLLQACEGMYTLENVDNTAVIELNDKANKTTHTLTFQHKTGLAEAPTVNVMNNLYSNQTVEQTLTLQIEGYDQLTAGYNTVQLISPSADIYKNISTLTSYINLTNLMEDTAVIDADGTASFMLETSDSSAPVSPGNYKFCVVFYNDGEQIGMKQASITIKVQKRTAVRGSFYPTTKYTLSTTDENGIALPLEELVEKEISFIGKYTGKDVSTRSLTVNSIQLVSTKGKINNFDDYFEWNAETGTISLKDTLSQEDLDYLMNKTKDARGRVIKSDADRKCYINYTATYGMNTTGEPFQKTGSALVTITVK